MRIGVYGGSFNPPHKGHRKLVREMSERLKLDKVIIIPSNISPQKSNNGNILPLHRLNMCRLAFSEERYEISDMEISRGGKSYTVDTLNVLRKKYPQSELFLFMGSDMFLSFASWYKPDEIMKIATICAMSRQNSDDAEKLRNYACNVLKSENILIFDIEPFEVSSTEIRQKLSEGADCSCLLDNSVITYIKDNGLYEN